MYDSNVEQLVVEIQEIQKKHIIVSLNFPKTQGTPRTRTLILHQLRFGIVAIIGMNPDEAQARDIIVKLIHNGFYTKAHVWVKMQDGAR